MLAEQAVGAADEVEVVLDAQDAAKAIGLVHVTDDAPAITRRKAGRGWSYRLPNGRTVTDRAVIARIRSLAIPPAYRDVWICPRADGHLQATGRDAKGRKQYRYHPAFRELRESVKYEHMTAFAEVLPGIRATVQQHMALPGLPRRKVLATIVHLLEATLIRVGNADYARQNKSYGLTTLTSRHVEIEGGELRFAFKGKSNKRWRLTLRDRRVARIIKACQALPGQRLFQYVDPEGEYHGIASQDVNDYLREITGRAITAKDFRTWAGTVLAALALHQTGAIDAAAEAKKNVRLAIEAVAARLGNTPTICRKCYVHPQVLDAYMAGELRLEIRSQVDAGGREDRPGLRPEETAVLALLERRPTQDHARH